MRVLLIFLLNISWLAIVFASVSCFTCSSELNGDVCEDPFNESKSNKINYSIEYPDGTICFKKRIHDKKTKSVDIERVGLPDAVEKAGCTEVTEEDRVVIECFCSGNLCNTAAAVLSLIHPLYLTIILLVSVFCL